MCQNTCASIFCSGARCQHMPLSYFSLLTRITAPENKFFFCWISNPAILPWLFILCVWPSNTTTVWSSLLRVTLAQHQDHLQFRHFQLSSYTVIAHAVGIRCFCSTKFGFAKITHYHKLNRCACTVFEELWASNLNAVQLICCGYCHPHGADALAARCKRYYVGQLERMSLV